MRLFKRFQAPVHRALQVHIHEVDAGSFGRGRGWFWMKCFLVDLQSSGIVHFGVTALDWAYMPELTM
jgi:hypothetical protein